MREIRIFDHLKTSIQKVTFSCTALRDTDLNSLSDPDPVLWKRFSPTHLHIKVNKMWMHILSRYKFPLCNHDCNLNAFLNTSQFEIFRKGESKVKNEHGFVVSRRNFFNFKDEIERIL